MIELFEVASVQTVRCWRSIVVNLLQVGVSLFGLRVDLLLGQRVQNGRTVLFYFNDVLVWDCKEFYYLREDALACGVYQARDHFVGYVARWRPKHILELLRRKTLNYHVLLRFLHFIVTLKVKRISAVSCHLARTFFVSDRNFGQIRGVLVFFAQIDILQQALPSLLHLYETTFEALPEFVVCGASHVRTMPHVVLYELFYLIFPLRLQHHLLYRLHGYHQSVYILNQHIVTSDEQFFSSRAIRTSCQTCGRSWALLTPCNSSPSSLLLWLVQLLSRLLLRLLLDSTWYTCVIRGSVVLMRRLQQKSVCRGGGWLLGLLLLQRSLPT